MVMIKIEVCYASESRQTLLPLNVPAGSTVIKSIMASGILDLYPNIDLAGNVGIFSKKIKLDDIVKSGDRIEIYRPLKRSPNQSRLLRRKQMTKI